MSCLRNWSKVRQKLSWLANKNIHVNPERSFRGTNGNPPSEASQLRKGVPRNFQKPILQMVQSQLFPSYICEYNSPIL